MRMLELKRRSNNTDFYGLSRYIVIEKSYDYKRKTCHYICRNTFDLVSANMGIDKRVNLSIRIFFIQK